MNSNDAEMIDLVRKSGLIALDWYLARNPDIAGAAVDPVEHWYFTARTECRDPNFLFSVRDYLAATKGTADPTVNPLVHYLREGESESAAASPFFDAAWYRARYAQDIAASGASTALAHYLAHLRDPRFSPNAYFDTRYYLEQYPDVLSAEASPYQHFLTNGVLEGRNPSAGFETQFYIRRHGIGTEINAFTHYLMIGRSKGLVTHPAEDRNVFTEVQKWTSPGPLFKSVTEPPTGRSKTPQADVFAYYLPQFHPIELNDEAWGAGFTEWRNVARGMPRFEGHYQPRIPRDLGFYDLRSPEALTDQIKLAQSAGLKGFAFYYYNFDGDRVLDLPVELFMELDHDFSFFLIWANENWTRTWDGQDRQVIKGQEYSTSAMQAVAKDIARHMLDPRYYRVGDRPLFVIYRPGLIPDAKRYLARLRGLIAAEVGIEPLMFMAQGFGDEDPRNFTLDGALEFPPHKLGEGLPPINDRCRFYDHAHRGQVFSYDHFVEKARATPAPPYPLIRTVFPSWDNEARRPGYGMAVTGSTPQKYRRWLAEAVRFANRNPIAGQSIVAINAWNEWCEGAYLEPDVHYGAAYLEETRRAVFQADTLPQGEAIILVGHDGHRHGAQLLLFDIARQLKIFGHRVAILLLDGGPLEADYRNVSDYFAVLGGAGSIERVLRDPALRDYRCAITNTVVSGAVVPELKEHGIRVVSLVHEMGGLIAERSLQGRCEAIGRNSDLVVFPAECVRESFTAHCAIEEGHSKVMPQGIYNLAVTPLKQAKRSREPVIVNAGFGDLRKGYDLFIATANHFAEHKIPGRFVWVGDVERGLETWVRSNGKNFQQIPFTKEIYPIIETADLFLLTSREDPFPSVALEALAIGKPVVCFEGTGGIADFVAGNKGMGSAVPQFSIPAVVREISAQLLADTAARRKARTNLALSRFSFARYVSRLVEDLGSRKPSVGVVVPNYNYAKYLRLRVDSVLTQTSRPDQLFLLDDCSTDGSQTTISEIAAENKPFIATVFNTKNSGSPFVQWEAGAMLCSTKYVWIAEADDVAEPRFLEKTLAFMEEHGCDLCFTDSSQIDSDGAVLAPSYDYYLHTVDETAFRKSFVMGGRDFLRRMLSQKNIILNVSAVLWKRDVLLGLLQAVKAELSDYRVAGDWRLYAEVCARGGKIGYIAQPLNRHRRHPESATHAQRRAEQLGEIRRVHDVIRKKLGDAAGVVGRKQSQYQEEIAAQFNLPPAERVGLPMQSA